MLPPPCEGAPQVVEYFGRVPLVTNRADRLASPGRRDDRLGVLLGSRNWLLEVNVDAALERRHRRLSVREWWRADPDRVELLPREKLVPPLVDVRAGWRKAFGATRVDVADSHDLCVFALTQGFEVISGDQAGAHNPDAKRRLH